MNLPRMLRPLPARAPVRVVPAAVFDAPVTLVTGPAGAYAAETLAALLDRQGRWRQAVWLRTDARSSDVLASQLAGACTHRWAVPAAADRGVGAGHADHVPDGRGGTGTVSLRSALPLAPRGAVVVVELGPRATPAVGRLLGEIRRALVQRASNVVVVTTHITDRLLLPHDAVVASHALAADVRTAEPVAAAAVAERSSGALPEAACLDRGVLGRLRCLTAGRPALTLDVVEAARVWPPDLIAGAIAGRATWRGLLDHVTAVLLAEATDDQRAALEQCVLTGYCHPQVVAGHLDVAALRPWVVPLEQGWGWLRPVWRAAVAHHLRTAPSGRATMRQRLREMTAASRDDAGTAGGVVVEARMLGAFELRVDGVRVAASPGHRGFAVLRYLLARPGRAAARDEILDAFWPDVDVDVARNRLQVAISGVRRAFRDITPEPVLEYRDGGYRIAPGVSVQTDVDAFEQWLVAGSAAESDGRVGDALSAYRAAVALWRGDYASETPYEQWSMFPREHLRLRYVDALDRMSRLQFAAGQIDACIVTAHRMLDVDPSREDAHRLLMRCYAGQGRMHSALRQYELCVRALRATVDAEPSADTLRLRDAVLSGMVTAA